MKLISIEDQIIKATIMAFLTRSCSMRVKNSEETEFRYTTADVIFAMMKTTDEDYLLVFESSGLEIGWVRFVYGNEDIEVINDF